MATNNNEGSSLHNSGGSVSEIVRRITEELQRCRNLTSRQLHKVSVVLIDSSNESKRIAACIKEVQLAIGNVNADLAKLPLLSETGKRFRPHPLFHM